MARDGWRFILPLAAVGVGCLFCPHWSGKTGGAVFLILAVFCVFFFRDFSRATPIDPALIYSPGDGQVMEVASFLNGAGERGRLIRIFLSIFDVHVQRAPVAGQVDKITYKKGSFLDARDSRAHIQNEQNSVVFSSPRGKVEVTQIAGLIARRIVCWAKEGQAFEQGQRYGLIRFGSQVDVYVPDSAEVMVKKGDRVKSGITVVAKWK
jgi:phosphatidylserine decarboxylase